MNIIYKVVAVLLALAVIPVLIFVPMYSYAFPSSLLGLFSDAEYIADTVSVADLVSTVGGSADFSGQELPDDLAHLITRIESLAAFLLLIAIAAVVAAVLAAVKKSGFAACCAAGFGITLTIIFLQFFNASVEPLMNGDIDVSQLLNSFTEYILNGEELSSITSIIIGSAVSGVEYIALSGGIYYVFALFGGIIIWTAAYNLTKGKDDKIVKSKA